MKLFQQLMLAPAARSGCPYGRHGWRAQLRRRLHASADEQVTSISQFSDVYPTDWAYQALANLDRALRLRRWLSQRHLPRQPRSFPLRSSSSAERLPSIACGTEITDEVRRLMKAFEKRAGRC